MLSGIVELDETYGGKVKGKGVHEGARTRAARLRELVEKQMGANARVVMTDHSAICRDVIRKRTSSISRFLTARANVFRYTKSGPVHTNTEESAFFII
jgi:hypothetical protein